MRKILLICGLVLGLLLTLAGCATQTAPPVAPTTAPGSKATEVPKAAPTTAPAAPKATEAPKAAPTTAPTTAPAAPKATDAPKAAPTTAPAPKATDMPKAAAKLTGEIIVFAAASLTEAFKEVGANFEAANPGTKITFNYAGSQQLLQQITQGAPADVFASAAATQMDAAIAAGSVDNGAARTFVRNRLVVIVPVENRAGIKTLQDLTKPGIKIVLADKAVPVGQYALDFMDKAVKDTAFGAAYKDDLLKNVVSYEQNVRAVLGKITLGEGDAGIVYTTDVTLDAAPKVIRIDIPDTLNTIAAYYIAPVKASKNLPLAAAFMGYVLSPAAQTVLVKYGFISATGDATGSVPSASPLSIAGLVDKPMTLTAADIRTKTQTSIKATERGGSEQTFTGVFVSALLKDAGIKADAKTVTFVGGDGYIQELPAADVLADQEAIVVVEAGDALRNIHAKQLPRYWVKGLVKIEVK